MKNFAQLYLYVLAVFTVGQSLAADISPPLFVRGSLLVGIPELEVSGLGKRGFITTFSCPVGSFDCGGGNGCCPFGTSCEGNALCGGATCGAGSTDCYGACCEAGYACKGKGQPCLKVDVTINTNTNTYTNTNTNTISIPITGGVSTTSLAPIPGTTLSSSSTTTMTPTTTKAATSGTTIVNTYSTIPIKSTSTMANSVPTPPSMTPGGYPSNSTVSAGANSSGIPIIPIGGGNSLKPGAWLGALGAVFFFAFFHM